MTVLAFDTETTGLTVRDADHTHPNQPHLVQLGLSLQDDDGAEQSYVSFTVRPEGFVIPTAASDVHGITHARALATGLPLVLALSTFSLVAKTASVHVAHNAEYDLTVLRAAFYRANRTFPELNVFCTKVLAEPVLKLPPSERMVALGYGHKFKSPTLAECVRFLFGEEIQGAHDALVDARACGRVYFELLKRRRISGES